MRPLIFMCVLLLYGCVGSNTPSQNERVVPSNSKRIALTFDDGPRGSGPKFAGDERAEALIEALALSSGQPAAFFIKTSNFKKQGGRQRIQRYAEAGHLIANHTHSHNWLSRTDANEYIADIDQAEELLRGFTNRRPWFRFPYLDEGREINKRDDVQKALASRKLFNAYVTVDNYDWYIERKWQDAVKDGKSVDMQALQTV
ncbi:MAG: polysaccharide deacetylase family protein, partial [Gammaproteobacteria bacterium]